MKIRESDNFITILTPYLDKDIFAFLERLIVKTKIDCGFVEMFDAFTHYYDSQSALLEELKNSVSRVESVRIILLKR